jgi:DNA-binding NarL/FixJ family response regulator
LSAEQESSLISRWQREVLALVADGLTNKAIAAQCDVSEQTIKRHVSALLRAFGVSNRASLVRQALRRGAIDAD